MNRRGRFDTPRRKLAVAGVLPREAASFFGSRQGLTSFPCPPRQARRARPAPVQGCCLGAIRGVRTHGPDHLERVERVDRRVVLDQLQVIFERQIVGDRREVLLEHPDVPLDDLARFPSC